MNEVWKDVPEYEGLYQVSNLGRVRSLDRIVKIRHKNGCVTTRNLKGKIIKLHLDIQTNYLTVNLCVNCKSRTKTTHRLVAQTFIPNPENKPEVNHKDGNIINNNVNNLEWCTRSENEIHKYKVLNHKGVSLGRCGKRVKCLETGRVFNSFLNAAHELKINASSISRACQGKRKTAGGYHWELI